MTYNLQGHAANAIKDAPPVAVGGIVLFGVELSDLVLILTAVYTVMRILIELHNWFKDKGNE